LHGSLNAGFNAAGDENSFKAAVAELDGVGIERVLACIEQGEAEGPIPRGGSADFNAGGLVAQNNGDAGKRG
jgi:ribosomal protein L12E/L44/L45/RPP1/RPP2